MATRTRTGVTADLTRRLDPGPSAMTAVSVAGADGMFVPTGTDDRWIYAREWHPEQGERIEDWTPERILAPLRTATGFAELRPQVVSVIPFAMGAHLADTFRSGATFLVGDAAHRRLPGGHRHEHRDPRRTQPRVEARLGPARLGR